MAQQGGEVEALRRENARLKTLIENGLGSQGGLVVVLPDDSSKRLQQQERDTARSRAEEVLSLAAAALASSPRRRTSDPGGGEHRSRGRAGQSEFCGRGVERHLSREGARTRTKVAPGSEVPASAKLRNGGVRASRPPPPTTPPPRQVVRLDARRGQVVAESWHTSRGGRLGGHAGESPRSKILAWLTQENLLDDDDDDDDDDDGDEPLVPARHRGSRKSYARLEGGDGREVEGEEREHTWENVDENTVGRLLGCDLDALWEVGGMQEVVGRGDARDGARPGLLLETGSDLDALRDLVWGTSVV
jgi:hypothetical protein